MCGRAATPAEDEAAGAAGVARWQSTEGYAQRFNAAPGAFVPVLRCDNGAGDGAAAPTAQEGGALAPTAQEGGASGVEATAARSESPTPPARVLSPMRWGLVTPSQTDSPDYVRMFNARNETVTEKPVFARLLPAKRCVVLLSGFYEWRTEGSASNSVKQPYYVSCEGDLLRIAALYDCVQCADGQPLWSVTLITREPLPRMRWLHDRAPLLLSRDDAEAWLAPDPSPSRLLQRLSTSDSLDLPALRWYPVSTALNKLGNRMEGPECIKETPREVEKHSGSLKALFARGSEEKRVTSPQPEGAAAAAPAGGAKRKAEATSSPAPSKSPAAKSGGQRSLSAFFGK